MRFLLDTRLTVEQNAAVYFEKAKKAKKKLKGARETVATAKEKIAHEREKQEARAAKEALPKRKPEWFEKFRWFISSEGILCVAGRDASTNEIVVKRHADPADTVFHTDMAGSPFVVVKGAPGQATLEEAAAFAASFSRAWKAGVGSLEVFYARPEQFSKTAEAGEFLGKGAFVVRGHVHYMKPRLGVSVGREPSGRVMVGPHAAVKAHCGNAFPVLQGNDKTSDVAKKLGKKLGVHPDDIIPLLPPGGVKLGA